MISIWTKLSKTFQRPSIANAIAGSLALHFSALIAVHFASYTDLQRISFSGQREVIQVEAAFAPMKSSSSSSAVVIEASPPPSVMPLIEKLQHKPLSAESRVAPTKSDVKQRIAASRESIRKSHLAPAPVADDHQMPDRQSKDSQAKSPEVKPLRPAAQRRPRSTAIAFSSSQVQLQDVSAEADAPPEAHDVPNAPLPTDLARATEASEARPVESAVAKSQSAEQEPIKRQRTDRRDDRPTLQEAEKPKQQRTAPSVASIMSQAMITVEQMAGLDDKTPPDFSGNAPPAYPSEAIRRQQQGTVMLRLTISATGKVESVAVAESSGFAILDHAAVEAVRKWHGKPALKRGEAAATVELLPVRFLLD